MKRLILLILLFSAIIVAQTTHRFYLNKINLPIDNKDPLSNIFVLLKIYDILENEAATSLAGTYNVQCTV